jgi:branched-chain amino acid transport system ATP-binding protein
MENGVVLRAEAISVRYGRIEALHPLSLTVGAGGLLLVLGPNGAGKTSLLRALAGAVPAASGRVYLAGKDMSRLPAHRRSRAGMALVPEGRGRLPGLTVEENLDLGHRAAGVRAGARDDDFAMVFDLFPPLRERLRQDCSTLSGGEMQMLAIARALLMRPSLLMLDEPSLGLAPQATARVYRALHALAATGLAMLVVEQKAVPLPHSRETTIVLRNGRLVFREDRRPSSEELSRLYLGERAAAS